MEKSEDVLIVITPSSSPFFATFIDMFSVGSIDSFGVVAECWTP